jgi:HEAT repeat protein
MIAIASLVLTVVAVEVGRARQKAEIRKEYPQRSVEELIRIARKDKDVSALDAIMMKRDPQSIPALCQILRDPEESVKLRMVAAQILGQLGGKEAREALEEVGRQDVHQYLREAIDYALEALNRRQERPAKNP